MDHKAFANGLRGDSTPLSNLKGKSMVIMGSKNKAGDQLRSPADDLHTPLNKSGRLQPIRTPHQQQGQVNA